MFSTQRYACQSIGRERKAAWADCSGKAEEGKEMSTIFILLLLCLSKLFSPYMAVSNKELLVFWNPFICMSPWLYPIHRFTFFTVNQKERLDNRVLINKYISNFYLKILSVSWSVHTIVNNMGGKLLFNRSLIYGNGQVKLSYHAG